MECEDWFVTHETMPFKVKGKEFGYEKASGGVQNSWMNEYMELKKIITSEHPKGEQQYVKNIEIFNLCKLRNITKTPFSPELIQKILKLKEPTEWIKLTSEQRRDMLKELDADFFEEVIIQINKLKTSHEEQKKN